MSRTAAEPMSGRDRPYTREEAVASLKARAVELGHTPTKAEYSAGGCQPHFDTIGRRKLFPGGWTEAIRAAGLPARAVEKRHTKRDIEKLLKADAERRGRPPLAIEWIKATKRRPCTGTVVSRFGSWAAALEACGLSSTRARARPGAWTAATIVDAYQSWTREHDGVPPTSTAWMRAGVEHPCATTVRDVMGGSWAALVEAVAEAELPETPEAALGRKVGEIVARVLGEGESGSGERLAILIEALQELQEHYPVPAVAA